MQFNKKIFAEFLENVALTGCALWEYDPYRPAFEKLAKELELSILDPDTDTPHHTWIKLIKKDHLSPYHIDPLGILYITHSKDPSFLRTPLAKEVCRQFELAEQNKHKESKYYNFYFNIPELLSDELQQDPQIKFGALYPTRKKTYPLRRFFINLLGV